MLHNKKMPIIQETLTPSVKERYITIYAIPNTLNVTYMLENVSYMKEMIRNIDYIDYY